MTVMMQKNTQTGAASGTSSIYLLLAAVFRDVASADLINALRTPEVLGAFAKLGCRFEDDFLNPPVDEMFVERLALDYTQLFIGPKEFISPHESIFHERDDDDWGKLWGADTARVKKFMESAGIEFAPDYGGIPDHISIELEFLGKVTEKNEEAQENDSPTDALYFLKMKKLFLDEHLGQWVKPFCDKARAKAESSFYRAMIGLLAEFIAMEHGEIDAEIESLAA